LFNSENFENSKTKDFQDNQEIIKDNKIKKLSIEEIKKNAKNFIENLQKEHRFNDEETKDKNFKSDYYNQLTTITNSDNKLVNVLSDNLKTLDNELFKIKYNILFTLK